MGMRWWWAGCVQGLCGKVRLRARSVRQGQWFGGRRGVPSRKDACTLTILLWLVYSRSQLSWLTLPPGRGAQPVVRREAR